MTRTVNVHVTHKSPADIKCESDETIIFLHCTHMQRWKGVINSLKNWISNFSQLHYKSCPFWSKNICEIYLTFRLYALFVINFIAKIDDQRYNKVSLARISVEFVLVRYAVYREYPYLTNYRDSSRATKLLEQLCGSQHENKLEIPFRLIWTTDKERRIVRRPASRFKFELTRRAGGSLCIRGQSYRCPVLSH